jgi:hypothetical protein
MSRFFCSFSLPKENKRKERAPGHLDLSAMLDRVTTGFEKEFLAICISLFYQAFGYTCY